MAISLPATRAAGLKKRSKADKARCMHMAQGSLEECRYYLIGLYLEAALAYYHANRDEIDADIAAEEAEADRLEREHGLSR